MSTRTKPVAVATTENMPFDLRAPMGNWLDSIGYHGRSVVLLEVWSPTVVHLTTSKGERELLMLESPVPGWLLTDPAFTPTEPAT